VIPVRGGSKGLQDKNIHPFCGTPLLTHSVRQAAAAGIYDHIVVTSDRPDYLQIARDAGASLLIDRPQHLSSDSATSLSVLRHALEESESRAGAEASTITLLQATSPLRKPDDIIAALALLEADVLANNIVSVTATKDGPLSTLVSPAPRGYAKRLIPVSRELSRRQDAPALFRINGSIYAWRRRALIDCDNLITARTLRYEMTALYSFDIDCYEDLMIAQFVATTLLPDYV
jgi:CMP-N,N'-diacetyllegionaminic acid synthase